MSTGDTRIEGSLRFLAELDDVLASSAGDYALTLTTIARLAVPTLADFCFADVLGRDGSLDRVAASHADPGQEALLRELQRKYPPDPRYAHSVSQVLSSGEPDLLPEVTDAHLLAFARDDEHLALLETLGPRSFMCVPLRARGRVLGALTLGATTSGRRYGEPDVIFAQEVAGRAALAIDNARLLRDAQEAERRAQKLAESARAARDRMAALAAALDRSLAESELLNQIASAASGEDDLARILEGALERLGAVVAFSGGSIAVLEGERLVVRAAVGPGGPAPVGREVARGDGPAWRVIDTGTPLLISDLRETGRLGDPPVRAVLGVPLRGRGRVFGILEIDSAEPNAFGQADLALVQRAAALLSGSVEIARRYGDESRALAEAEAANRAKDEFLATVSHELRTPLNAMVGWLSLLRTGRLDEEARERAIETLDRNTRLQTQLIEDLLDVSRIVTGKVGLEMARVDLAAVAADALEAARPAARARSVELEADLAPATVRGDGVRLAQIVGNLLSNAVKFSPEGAAVRLRVGTDGGRAVLSVSDDGAGIRPEFLPHVFERFRQADTTLTRAHTGLGLGLSIVRHLVTVHGGTVRAESAGEGRGSVFTVELPAFAGEETTPPTPPGPRPAAPGRDDLSGLRVLVVDDNRDALELLGEALGRAGAEVTAVRSAGAAFEAMDRAIPDVIVSDIGMPEMDGYTFMRLVRSREPGRGGLVPAIALSAYARGEDRRQALGAGYQLHIEKPAEPARVVAAVAEVALERG